MAEENNAFNDKVEEIKDDVKDAIQEMKEDLKDLQDKVDDKIEDIKAEVDDFSAEMDPEDVEKNKLFAVLAYIGVLVLIPIFLAKDSKFARFHANQGLVLFLLELVFGALIKVKLIGWLFAVAEFAVVILAVVGVVYALQGKAKELPVVGNWKILK